MEGAAAGQEAASAAGHSSKLFLKTRASQLVLHEDMFADSTARVSEPLPGSPAEGRSRSQPGCGCTWVQLAG